MERKTSRVEVWGVLVVVVLMLGSQQQQVRAAGIYACWGGCYNQCFLPNSKTSPADQGLPCFFNCFRTCFPPPPTTFEEDNHNYYCHLGCSMETCIPQFQKSADAAKLEWCLGNCSDNCKP